MAAGGETSIRDFWNQQEKAKVLNRRLCVSALIEGSGLIVEEDDLESKGFVLRQVTAGSERFGIWVPDRTTTISKIYSWVDGSGGPSVDWDLNHDADPTAVGTEVITGGGSTSATTSIDSVSSFNNPVLIAGRALWIEVTAVTGTVDSFHMSIHFDRSL